MAIVFQFYHWYKGFVQFNISILILDTRWDMKKVQIEQQNKNLALENYRFNILNLK